MQSFGIFGLTAQNNPVNRSTFQFWQAALLTMPNPANMETWMMIDDHAVVANPLPKGWESYKWQG
jgi:hypothetical protein